ncbi:MAG: hypothetical protein AAF554_00850 [Bacteroidota bacterium]
MIFLITSIKRIDFWTKSGNWVQPQYFDPFFEWLIVICIGIIILPILVKGLIAKVHRKKEKIHEREFKAWSKSGDMHKIENGMGMAMFLMVYMDYLLRIGQSLNEIEFQSIRIWNKHIPWHISGMFLSICYLSFCSVSSAEELMVHKWAMFILCTVLLIPLFSNVHLFYTRLDAEVKNLKKCYSRILEVTVAYKENGKEGVIKFMDIKFLEE